jgi:hypothetical protein
MKIDRAFPGLIFRDLTACLIWVLVVFAAFSFSQSTDQQFPTAITENQISGQIRARDVGDARLTSYFYTFNGSQGDLFVNVVTKNLSGSIDIFAAEGMRPLTKILVYADLSQSETGRVIYLRKPEKLILRVEGRSPNDDSAEFQIKFAGGFEAAVPRADEPPVPKVTDAGTNESGVKVNSVGTIIAVIPKAKATPKADRADTEKVADRSDGVSEEEKKAEPAKSDELKVDSVAENKKSEEISKTKTDRAEKPNPRASSKSPAGRGRVRSQTATAGSKQAPVKTSDEPEKIETVTEPPVSKPPPRLVVTDNTKAETNPLANVHLVIVLKDGTRIERPMSEVLRFIADQRSLTVVNTSGKVSKFPILDVASVSIQ